LIHQEKTMSFRFTKNTLALSFVAAAAAAVAIPIRRTFGAARSPGGELLRPHHPHRTRAEPHR
jgi:hypothetical protein